MPHSEQSVQMRATLIGILAILLWSALALLTKLAGPLPPFELLALSFSIAFLTCAIFIARKGTRGLVPLKQPVGAWILCLFGLFVYHALYFFALSRSPVAQVSLIAYLWPLLIVILSSFFAGKGLQWQHLIAAAMGFIGTFLVLWPNLHQTGQTLSVWIGYGAAAGCGLVWSIYSVSNQRYKSVSSEMVGPVCAMVALIGWIAHRLLEPTIMPSPAQWGAIAALGIGPVGLAFLAWDHATKHGHVALLGVGSYAAPLLSTLLLIVFGFATAHWSLIVSAVLITAGTALSTLRVGSRSKSHV